MILPLSVAFISVLLGAGLALLGERFSRAMGVVRWFSLIAASAVVLGHLLPDAVEAVGWVALSVFLLALVMPVLIERLVGAVRGHKDSHAHDDCDHAHADADVGMELGYAGLLVHQVGDGFALSTYGANGRVGGVVLGVLVAIGLHTIPVAAFVVVAFFKHGGYRTATLRAGGLVIATWLGVFGVSMAPVAWMTSWEPWLTAVVAGLLFHVVVHDFRWSQR
jgi:zinc transporter ZupT